MKNVLNAVKRGASYVVLAGASVLPAISHAAPVAAVDVTDAATSLTNQIPSMTTILTTVLGLVALVMAFGWIRRVMK